MAKLVALVFLAMASLASALIFPTERPSFLSYVDSKIRHEPSNIRQYSRKHLDSVVTPAFKRGGAVAAMTFSVFIIGLNVILA